ncbi:MAG: DUF47 domain-containing protein [Acidobacteria bacterium]|nr:DUF47 domain-containing protein [Acidobacteriota bacterium]
MFKKLLPREVSFFDYFEQHVDTTLEASKIFLEITSNGPEMESKVSRIKALEHQADNITHKCIEALHKTFITPIDRHEIHALIKRLDDITDDIDGAAARLVMYELTSIRSEARDLAEILVKACTELCKAVRGLRNVAQAKGIIDICIQVHQYENDGDVAMRTALVRLLKEEQSPVMVVKWKEIFEMLERATDSCEDVANIIEGVVIEAS